MKKNKALEILHRIFEFEEGGYIFKREAVTWDYRRHETEYTLFFVKNNYRVKEVEIIYQNNNITIPFNKIDEIFTTKIIDTYFLKYIEDIDERKHCKIINFNIFLNYFKVKEEELKFSYYCQYCDKFNLLYQTNEEWSSIEYAGIIIRHKYYRSRYSDFGSDNWKITAIGNPIYFSPYLKKPIEMDVFDSERTNIKHIYPSNYKPKEQTQNIMEDFLAIVFEHFFENKDYVALNLDDNIDLKYSNNNNMYEKSFSEIIKYHMGNQIKIYALDKKNSFEYYIKNQSLEESIFFK